MIRTTSVALAVLLGVVFATGTVEAGTPDPSEILAKMDKKTNGFDDVEQSILLTITDIRGKAKAYEFNIKQRGVQRLIVFETGESKGQAVLIEDLNRMYIYLPPPMNKVQKVAVGNMRQSFLGSDWSNTDMSVVDWSETYDVTFDHEDADFWYLQLIPKKGQDTGYARVVHKINKSEPLIHGTDYFDEKGTLIKVFWIDDVRDYHGVNWPRIVGMKDPRTGHQSVMTVKDLKVNQGFKKSMFTPRYLKWLK